MLQNLKQQQPDIEATIRIYVNAPGLQCNIVVVCAILAKMTFFENMKWEIILHIFMKSLALSKLKKSKTIVKFKKHNVVGAHEFSLYRQ